MKLKLTTLALFLAFGVFGQGKHDTIRVIAILVSPGEGSKIHVAEYQVIKILEGQLTSNRIKVGYYFYNEDKDAPDTAILTLTSYTGSPVVHDYYIFPDYNQIKGIEKIQLSTINFSDWEGCEAGKKTCRPLTFYRDSGCAKWFLIMPCGGTSTIVTLNDAQYQNCIQKVSIAATQCPPAFELTNLPDGKYYANMLACELGGEIEINIKTVNK